MQTRVMFLLDIHEFSEHAELFVFGRKGSNTEPFTIFDEPRVHGCSTPLRNLPLILP